MEQRLAALPCLLVRARWIIEVTNSAQRSPTDVVGWLSIGRWRIVLREALTWMISCSFESKKDNLELSASHEISWSSLIKLSSRNNQRDSGRHENKENRRPSVLCSERKVNAPIVSWMPKIGSHFQKLWQSVAILLTCTEGEIFLQGIQANCAETGGASSCWADEFLAFIGEQMCESICHCYDQGWKTNIFHRKYSAKFEFWIIPEYVVVKCLDEHLARK